MQFGTNHLGHFALTGLLLDLMLPVPGSRVVTVSSIGHRIRAAIHFDDLQWDRSYNRVAAYGQSKLANLMFTYELQRRLARTAPPSPWPRTPACPAPSSPATSPRPCAASATWLAPLITQTRGDGRAADPAGRHRPRRARRPVLRPRRHGRNPGYPKVVASSKQSHDASSSACGPCPRTSPGWSSQHDHGHDERNAVSRAALSPGAPREHFFEGLAKLGDVDRRRTPPMVRRQRQLLRRVDGQPGSQIRRRPAALGPRHLLGWAGRDDASARVTCAGAEIDDPVRFGRHTACRARPPRPCCPHRPAGAAGVQQSTSARVQPGRRLVEHVERVPAAGSLQLGRQLDPLRLAAGQLGGRLPEPQIAEPDFAQRRQAARRRRRRRRGTLLPRRLSSRGRRRWCDRDSAPRRLLAYRAPWQVGHGA